MTGPQPRSWKDADGVAAAREFLAHRPPRKAAIRDLMREVLSPDPFVRRCAADLARRVSARQPGVFAGYAGVFIDILAELPIEEWQTRGYCLLAAAWNARSLGEQLRAATAARRLIEDERTALRAIGVEALALLGAAAPELHDEAVAVVELARQDAIAALRCRARRMVPMLLSGKLPWQRDADRLTPVRRPPDRFDR